MEKTSFSKVCSIYLPVTFPVILAAFLFTSCVFGNPSVAVIQTDRPEFAIYAEYFNSSQDKYKVETRYSRSLTQKPFDAGNSPDLVVGSWLKSVSTRNLFKSLDYLLKRGIDTSAFYSRLLSLGKIEDKQYLLPVSFNIPAMVVSKNNSYLLSNPFVIEPKEIREVGSIYNRESGGAFTQMGFSPSWNDEFIFVIATLFNTGFREAKPLTWDNAALEESIQYIRAWGGRTDTNVTMENDFSFKYFFMPQVKLAISGRILFCYLDSSEIFTLAGEQRDALDFRWIAGKDGTIPLVENTTYYGISKNARAKKAAEAFTLWFFREDTQRLLLEESGRRGITETLFGIGGGFSAMRTVTEQIFPRCYPGLIGHMPPEAALSPPNILPHNWMDIKRQVILPYLHDRILSENGANSVPDLDRRLADWLRVNRDS